MWQQKGFGMIRVLAHCIDVLCMIDRSAERYDSFIEAEAYVPGVSFRPSMLHKKL